MMKPITESHYKDLIERFLDKYGPYKAVYESSQGFVANNCSQRTKEGR